MAVASMRDLRPVRKALLAWYSANKRAMPWRGARDPYRIWLSEVMLQQTRVAAVVDYYRRFLRRFPTVRALARAPQSAVLKHWAGLGYYSRARNLHRAAKQIVAKHGGHFPCHLDAALALPGVGAYTAAAVLSIAYRQPRAVLDGNVARVLARLNAIRGDLRAKGRWRKLQAAAQQLMDPRHPADWNQAMMELGATLCTPRAPRCDACPLSRWCRAMQFGIAEQLPATRRKRAAEKIHIAAAVLLDPRSCTLLLPPNGASHDGLFSRMWQFPAVEGATKAKAHLRKKVSRLNNGTMHKAATDLIEIASARHTVTFREITLTPYVARVERLPRVAGACTPRLGQLDRLPVSSATRKIARRALEHLANATEEEAVGDTHR